MPQSALSPAGQAAQAHAELAWVLFAGGAAIFLVVMALVAWALMRRRRELSQGAERALVIGGGIVFPTVVLGALLAWTLPRLPAAAGEGDAALRIEVTGEQWWWRVRYLGEDGRPAFETANEIRIPAGQPVLLELKAADVIHSFWVPSLAGKLDMIPGRTTRLRLHAARPGEYRGQCAEYCGGPHALMAFLVIAEEAAAFRQWADNQKADAKASHPLFVQRCGACHAVRGTSATGRLGPDLTHVGSRRTLGAALLPMNRGALAGWIASSQHLKPGNLMPSFKTFTSEELQSLAAYLESLE